MRERELDRVERFVGVVVLRRQYFHAVESLVVWQDERDRHWIA